MRSFCYVSSRLCQKSLRVTSNLSHLYFFPLIIMNWDAMKTTWSGRWDQLIGRVKEEYGEMSNDPSTIAEGEWDQLIGRIKEETGEAEEEIYRRLSS